MGASRVKGIVIEIGGDTTGLDKALSGVNKNISATQSQLRDVNNLLKLDDKNVTLLEQKQRLLAQATEETSKKLKTLKDANEQASKSVKNYDAWKAAYDPIQAEITATDKQLRELRDRQQELSDCGEVDTDAYKQLTAEAENASKKLRELKKQAKAVSDEFGNPISPAQYDALQREIISTERDLKGLEEEADKTDSAIKSIRSGAITDVDDAAKKAADSLGDAKKEAADFGDVLKAGMISEAAGQIVDSLKNVAEETKEYRKIMGSLDVSSQRAGYTAEETEDAYRKLYGVLADDQSAATTLANLQALQLPQGELLGLIDSTVGAWAAYGDSIPIDSLAESVNETIRAGQVTGTFADVLNWGAKEGETYGVMLRDNFEFTKLSAKELEKLNDSQRAAYEIIEKRYDANEDWNSSVRDAATAEDFFNLALSRCTTEAERADLVMQAFADQGLSSVGEQWQQNNESMVEANQASADMQEQLAILGEKIEPLVTMLTNAAVAALDWFNSLEPSMQGFILAAVLIAAAIAPIVSSFGAISKGIDGIATRLPGIQTAFSSVFSFIVANPIALLIAAIVGLVVLIATKGDEIQAILQKVDAFLQGVFTKDWTTVFGPVLGGILNGFFGTVKRVWDSIYQIFNGVIDFISGVFAGDWKQAWEGIKEVFSGIFDGLAAIAAKPINTIIGYVNSAITSINWLIDKINQIPGVNIRRRLGTLPMLASGGTVRSGSAIVGEAGPELLTVGNGAATVQPLTAKVDGASLAAAIGGTSTTPKVYVNFTGSLAQLAAVLQPVITVETARRGPSFTKG